MTSWKDALKLTSEVPAVPEGSVVYNVFSVGKSIPNARLKRLRYQPAEVMARLFSLWCHKRGYFFSRSEPLCAVRTEVEQRPDMGTVLHYYYADYGVVA